MIQPRLSALLLALAAIFTLLMTSASPAAEPGGAGGWKPLFNGTNLDGWYVFLKDQGERNRDTNHLVQVHGGAIHMYKDVAADSKQPFGYIATEKEFTSYHLRLEYKWGGKKFDPRNKPTSKRDAGLLYHTGGDKVWPDSVECQIQEGDVGDIFAVSTRVTSPVDPKTTTAGRRVSTNKVTNLVETNYVPVFMEEDKGGVPYVQGSVGTSWRIVRNPLNEQDGWNTVEVIVRGDTATHIVNGKINNRCSDFKQWVNGEWVTLKKGRIALQLEGAEILYRNIEIQELKD